MFSRCRTWVDKDTKQPSLHVIYPFYPLIPLFPHAYISPNHLLSFGSSPEYPIVSLVQSENALPLHSTLCPTPPGSDPPSL